MPPQLALIICTIFVLYLFYADLKKCVGSSRGLWIPLIWMFLAGTREFSQWLQLRGPGFSSDAYLEGNPVNLIVQLFLILVGVIILSRRRQNWGQILPQNRLILLYFLFCGLSICWSDYPFVSFKRLIKSMGTLVMALVILTESRPYESVGVVLRRFAYLVIPFSVIFCKYYPELGRGKHHGSFTYTGMAGGKNGLGMLCLLSGIYFLWSLLPANRQKISIGSQTQKLLNYTLLAMIAWLLYVSNSATSLACLIVALCVLLGSRIPTIAHEPRRIMTLVILCTALWGIMELAFNVDETLISMLGRRPDLTSRVPMWEDLLGMVKNPLIGFGYESFWLGDRMEYIWGKWGHLIQAHNGYLETYLNLGLIGLFLILGTIFSGLLKVRRLLPVNYPTATLRLTFIVVVALYNWTEATFYGISNMWLLFFLGVIEIPAQQQHNSHI